MPSRAGDTALLTLSYDVEVTAFRDSAGIDALHDAARPATDAGYQVELGGQVPEHFSAPDGTAEAVGMGAALVILVLALGAVVSAGLPLLVALAGLALGTGLITLLSAVTDISNIAPTVASVVGLGVGIDYALLLVARHVEGLRRGLDARAAATTGGCRARSTGCCRNCASSTARSRPPPPSRPGPPPSGPPASDPPTRARPTPGAGPCCVRVAARVVRPAPVPPVRTVGA
ncbi:MMPL family transporter [Kitasatospora griseola]|uniref:MMPL family transporter n=1 Tax=Kitasatospora griseola TaxID=2064 RepID=UPI0037FDB66D